MYRNAPVATDASGTASAVPGHVAAVVDRDGRVLIVRVIGGIAQVLIRTTPAGFGLGSAALAPEIAESIVGAERQAAKQHLGDAQNAIQQAGVANVE